jgi:predicted DNA-binding transcriptional regulator AlpA
MMKRGTAAAYCDITPVEFDREVIAGRLPSPVRLGNAEHWSRALIDECLANLAGEGPHDWRKGVKAYAA